MAEQLKDLDPWSQWLRMHAPPRVKGYLEAGAIIEAIGDFRLDLDASGRSPYGVVVIPWEEAGGSVTVDMGYGTQYGVNRAEVKRWQPAPKTRDALERWLDA